MIVITCDKASVRQTDYALERMVGLGEGEQLTIVAVEGANGDWAAYASVIDSPGFVAEHGVKISERAARQLFAGFTITSLKWRD